MYEKSVLDNGLRVLSESMPNTRSVSICVFVGTGSRYEEDSKAGISHFLEHMLFKGTHRRPSSAEISGAVEGVGGIMNGGTDRELTTYWCKVAQPHFNKAVDVLMDMMYDPLIVPEEVEKERRVVQVLNLLHLFWHVSIVFHKLRQEFGNVIEVADTASEEAKEPVFFGHE